MVETPPWVEYVYNLDWPDHLIDKDTWLGWHQDAKRGRRPDIVDVVTKQYDRLAPWYIREGVWGPLADLGLQKGKLRLAREMSRGVGKTVGQALLFCYLGEYVAPYINKLPNGMNVKPENRRMNIIGRSARYVGNENMNTSHQMLSYHAPWLKLPDQPDLWDDPDAVLERQIRKRKFNDTRHDFVTGSSVRGYGWDQSTRGSHPLIASVDDLVTDDNWHHAEEQYRVLQSGIVPSVVPGGAIVVSGTPQAPGDFYDIMAETGSWDYKRYPGYDTDGSLGYRKRNEQDIDAGYLPEGCITREEDWHCLNPLFLPYDELELARGQTRRDEVSFLREYMLQRVVQTLQLVNPNDFEACKRPELHYVHSTPSNHPYPVYCGIDPSMLKKSDMAFVVVDVRENEARRILAIETIPSEERGDPLDLIRKINNLHDRYHPQFLIEGNGFQAFINPFMRALRPGLRINDLSVTSIKHKSGGWPLVSTYSESHSLEIPYGPTPGEKQLIANGHLGLEDCKARQLTDRLEKQALSLMYANGEVVENKNVKTDIFSAVYLALKASEEGRGTPPGVAGVDAKKLMEEKKRNRSPELSVPELSPRGVPGSTGNRLSKALRLDRR